MFAAVGPFEAAHQRRGFFCDCAHLSGAVAPHVQNGAHMQRTHRCVRIPGATRAMARKHLGERVGVVGQVLQRHRAVLDKADRFAIALEAHHDVQARFAHLPQRFLLRVLRHVDHTVRQPQIAHQRGQLLQLGHHRSLAVAAKFHQQNGVRPADQGGLHHRLKSRVRQAQRHHAAVHQFHRCGPELDDVLRRQHGVAKAGEVHDAQHLGTGQGAQLQRQVFGVSQCAFGADQQVRQVDAAVRGVRALALVTKNVQVVAAHAAHDLGPQGIDVSPVALSQTLHKVGDAAGGC